MSKRQGRSFSDVYATAEKKPFEILKEEPKKQSPEQGGVSGTSGTFTADVAGCSGASQQAHHDQAEQLPDDANDDDSDDDDHSAYMPVLDRSKEKSIGSYLSRLFWNTQSILPFFIAYFHPDSQDILLLICCPAHLRPEVISELKRKDITSYSEVSSKKDMVPNYDKAFVFVSGGIRPYCTEDMEEFYLVLTGNMMIKAELRVRFVSNKDPAQVEFYSTSKPSGRTLLCKLHLKVPSLSVDRTGGREERVHQDGSVMLVKHNVIKGNGGLSTAGR